MTDAPQPVPEAPVRAARLDTRNTLRLPCAADALLEFDDRAALTEALDWCARHQLQPLLLGEGSNVVLPERLRRAVLRSTDRRVEVIASSAERTTLRVGAGKNWHELVAMTVARGWYGLENLALIPGSVGAAPVQNIGAYGVELSSVVQSVHGVYTDTQAAASLSAEECAFAYRDSIFKHQLAGRFAITAVDLVLRRDGRGQASYPALAERLAGHAGPVTPEAVFAAVVALRRERLPDPATHPNAGSFFKNPVLEEDAARRLAAANPGLPVYPAPGGMAKLSAAWLIERCGFRGVERGRAAVSAAHALVLVNRGGVQRDLLSLAAEIRQAVAARFGCELEIEPVVLGDE